MFLVIVFGGGGCTIDFLFVVVSALERVSKQKVCDVLSRPITFLLSTAHYHVGLMFLVIVVVVEDVSFVVMSTLESVSKQKV
jgi:hypothetical protein